MCRREFRLTGTFRLFAARRPREPCVPAGRPRQSLRGRSSHRRGDGCAARRSGAERSISLPSRERPRPVASTRCHPSPSSRNSSLPGTRPYSRLTGDRIGRRHCVSSMTACSPRHAISRPSTTSTGGGSRSSRSRLPRRTGMASSRPRRSDTGRGRARGGCQDRFTTSGLSRAERAGCGARRPTQGEEAENQGERQGGNDDCDHRQRAIVRQPATRAARKRRRQCAGER
jgi:hypothetical protein